MESVLRDRGGWEHPAARVSSPGPTLFTIGYEKQSLDEFMQILLTAGESTNRGLQAPIAHSKRLQRRSECRSRTLIYSIGTTRLEDLRASSSHQHSAVTRSCHAVCPRPVAQPTVGLGTASRAEHRRCDEHQ